MATTGIVGLLGLKTSANPLIAKPGSLYRGDNIVLTPLGEGTQRRGQGVDGTIGAAGDKLFAVGQSTGAIVTHYGADSGTDGTALKSFNPSTLATTVIGNYAALAPAALRMKFAELAKAFCFTTSIGLQRIDTPITATTAAAPLHAGVPRPGDFFGNFLTGNVGANGTWFPKNSAVAYRAVIGRKDTNDTIRLSAPSGRTVVLNPADVVASLTRTGGTTVTATVVYPPGHNFLVGDILQISPGSADFLTATNYTVTAVTSTTIVWASAGANVTLGAQTLTSGSKTTICQVQLPGSIGIMAGDFVQIYRTLESSAVTVDPGDEEFLAFEQTLTAADIAAKYVNVSDTTPDSFLGAPLYTNANTGQGIAFEHNTPPLMRDVTVFDGRLWGTQTVDKHAMTLRLLGTGSPNGLQSGDLLGIDNRVYVMTAYIATKYLPSVNIQQTVASFVQQFTFGTAPIVGRAGSNGTNPTGSIVMERQTLTQGIFYAATSRISAWQEPMPTITAVTEASSSRTSNVVTITTAAAHGFSDHDNIVLAFQDGTTEDATFPAGVKSNINVTSATTFTYGEVGANAATITGTYYVFATTFGSKQNKKLLRFTESAQPEAWPLVNFPGGLPDGATVSRAKALGGSLYVFFTHGDIYTVSGSYPYNVQKFDGTASLVAPDTLEEHSGQLYGLTTQGLCAVSPNGVEVLSLDLDDTLRERIVNMSANGTTAVPFGVSYESDRQYQLWLPSNEATAVAASWHCWEAYVFHSDVKGFTRWEINRTCGLVYCNSDLLYMGGDDQYLRKESKGFTYLDAADKEVSLTYDDVQAGVLTDATDPYGDVNIGDVLKFSDNTWGTVTSATANKLTTDGAFSDVNPGSAQYWRSFCPLAVTWQVTAGGAPAIQKHWRDFMVHLNRSCISQFVASCYTERNENTPYKNFVTVTPATLVLGQAFADSLYNLRGSIPQNAQESAMLRLEVNFGARTGVTATYPKPQAFTQFKILGLSLTSEGISERTGAPR